MGGAYSLFFQCFPEERTRLMWVGYFHPVNFNNDEVIQLFCHNAGVELCDYFSDRSCLAGAECSDM